jgi:hypothetical protein
MFPINGANTIVLPSGRNGFRKKDKQFGIAGTELAADWLNDVQEEIINVLVAAGIVPAVATRTQLRDAIQLLVAGGGVPVGTVVDWLSSTIPSGYLKLNGALVSRTTYPALWAHASGSGRIVTEASWAAAPANFSSGDGATTFRLPEFRGEFRRAWDDGRGIDVGRALGTWQAQEIQSHFHQVGRVSNTASTGAGGSWEASSPTQPNRVDTTSTGGTETRPRNVAVIPIIRAL